MYARNPSIILQNMNFSRYYRYRAQLIYSFDLNIINNKIIKFHKLASLYYDKAIFFYKEVDFYGKIDKERF